MKHMWLRLRKLMLMITALYVICVVAGFVYGGAAPAAADSGHTRKLATIERVFGRFREPVRAGRPDIIALCAAIILLWNLLGSAAVLTFPCTLILPVALLFVDGWQEGIAIAQLRASSAVSKMLFLTMVGLELTTYPLSSVAGLNIGLSALLRPRFGTVSRWQAVTLAIKDAMRIYGVIFCILSVQAVAEILYVRAVLLHGGSGVPLEP